MCGEVSIVGALFTAAGFVTMWGFMFGMYRMMNKWGPR